MPELSRFFGIVIGVFYREHGRPHFHAVYGEFEGVIDIETGDLISGELPEKSDEARFGMAKRAYGGAERKLGACAATQSPQKDSASGVDQL